jgi:hypothetical protein
MENTVPERPVTAQSPYRPPPRALDAGELDRLTTRLQRELALPYARALVLAEQSLVEERLLTTRALGRA